MHPRLSWLLLTTILLFGCTSDITTDAGLEPSSRVTIQPTQQEVRNLSRVLNGVDTTPCEPSGALEDPDNESCDPLGRFTTEDVDKLRLLAEGTAVIAWGYSTEPFQLVASVDPGTPIPEPIVSPGLPTITFAEIDVVSAD